MWKYGSGERLLLDLINFVFPIFLHFMDYIDILGYLASALVAVSFLFKDLKIIRWINLIGCIFFVIYGYYIDSIPVMITNIFIVIVQSYYLFLAPYREG